MPLTPKLLFVFFFYLALQVKPLYIQIPEFSSEVFYEKTQELHFIQNSSSIKPNIKIIESTNLYDPPLGMKEVCKFSSRIPPFSIFKSKFNSNNSTVYVDQSLQGSSTIAVSIERNGYSVSFTNQQSNYLILSNTTTSVENYEIQSLDNTDLIFLNNIEGIFHVFSQKESYVPKSICPRDIKITFPLKPLIVLFFFLFFLRYIQIYFSNYSFKPIEGFWIFDNDLNRIYGEPLQPDPILNKYIGHVLKQTKITKEPSSNFVRLRRFQQYYEFQRTTAFPLGNYILAVKWFETLPPYPNHEVPFSCEFESQSKHIQIINNPKITFGAFREITPVHISFVLQDNVKYVVQLPATVLPPFQPLGRVVTVIESVLYNLIKLLKKNPYVHTNLFEMVDICGRLTNCKRIFFFLGTNQLLYQFNNENVEHFDMKFINNIPSKVDIKNGFVYHENFLEDGDTCFINVIETDAFKITSIFQCDYQRERSDDYFETHGFPIVNACCVFLYQLATRKEACLQFSRFINIFSNNETFHSYFEILLPSNNINLFYSKAIKSKPNTFKELLSLFKSVDKQLAKSIKEIINEKTKVSRRVISSQNEVGFNQYYSLTTTIKEDSNQLIIICLIEIITIFIEKEIEYENTLQDLQLAIETMEVKKFFIFNKKPILENDELYDELNVEASSSLELEQLVNKKDLEKFKELIEKGGKQTIRLNRFDGAQIWYYIACDDKQGYLFNVHEIADPKYRINTIDEGLQPAVSSNVIFWDVNPYTEAVSSIFNQPTIWDSLSVDQDWKFNRIVDFVHQDEQEFFNENYYRLLHGDLDKWNGELRLLRFSGQYEWHRISISWNNNLKILHCLAVNIHQQKEAENKLIESQTLRDLLFSSGKLALWTFSNDNNDIEPMHKFDYRSTTVVNMNWKFIDLYIHNDYRNLLKERIKRAFKNDEAIEMDLPLTLDDEIWVSIRGKVRTKSQLIVGVCIDITELRNAYNELEIEKKRAEEANRQKTVFLANMSHEIRTPMNGIFGMLDVLALQELTNEQRILVDSIRSSSFQLMKLLDDTLNMSKIEQGQFEYNPTIFNLTKLFEPICIATSSRARLNHLKFNLIIDKHFPILIYGDSQFFVQIINNLLSNSLKFTREGSITVILSWVEEEDGKELLELIVEDTGIGIGKEQLQVIFKRFSQANESVARFFGGTGLGLSLVQDILHYIGGNINLESELGKGTKFTVHMPYESIYVYFSPMFTDGNRHLILTCIYDPIIKKQLDEWIPYHKYEIKSFVESDEILQYSRLEKCVINAILVEGNSNKWPSFAKAASEISGYKPPIISMCEAGETSYFNLTIAKPVQMIHLMNLLDGFRYHLKNSMPSSNSDSMNDNDGIANVLVVEDNKNNQFVMKKILESLKCKHKIAENGLEAIKKLETDTFDLVFMDCQMPVLDGIEATKRIRRSNKIYASVPIIALTASAIEGDEQTCREAGMDGYIAKPVRIQQIHNIVKQFATRG